MEGKVKNWNVKEEESKIKEKMNDKVTRIREQMGDQGNKKPKTPCLLSTNKSPMIRKSCARIW